MPIAAPIAAPETRPRPLALIVAHGSPSAPMGPEAAFAQLAARTQARIARLRVRAATLAAPGALERAFATAPRGGVVLVQPYFMTDGWFVSCELRRRVAAAADGRTVRQLAPFGTLPETIALCARRARQGAEAAGLAPARTTLVIAAHGSPSDPRPARATEAAADRLRAAGIFAEVRIGYVDEAPALSDALRVEGPAICLPFFIGHAGHVEHDLPEAVARARFRGPVLDPIGTDAQAPAILAASFAAGFAAGRGRDRDSSPDPAPGGAPDCAPDEGGAAR